MAEAAIAAQSQAATNGARAERATVTPVRGAAPLARTVSDVAGIQRNFLVGRPSPAPVAEKATEKRSSASLLSTSALLLLAEARTLEAGINPAGSGLNNAHTNYVAVQAKVRETILLSQSRAQAPAEEEGESPLGESPLNI